MAHLKTRRAIIATARRMNELGINQGTSGYGSEPAAPKAAGAHAARSPKRRACRGAPRGHRR